MTEVNHAYMQVALVLPTKYLLQSSHPTQVWLSNYIKIVEEKSQTQLLTKPKIKSFSQQSGATSNDTFTIHKATS